MHFGSEPVLVTLSAESDPKCSADELIGAVDATDGDSERYPAVKYVFVDPETGG